MNKTTHKRLALVWLLVVGLLLSYSGYLFLEKRISLNTDILALLPAQQQDPVLQAAFNHMVAAAQQQVVVMVGARDWAQAMRAASAYEEVIAARPDLLQRTPSMSSNLENDWLAPFLQSRLNLLTPAQRTDLQKRPVEAWVNKALSGLYNPFSGPKLGAWQDDPFGLSSTWLQARAEETPVRPRDGRLFLEKEGVSYAVLMLQLQAPAFSMAAQRAVVPLLNKAKAAAQSAAAPVEIITAGVVLHAAAASQSASQEMSTIAVGSLLGVILLMWLSFRSLKPLLLIGLSIAVGCLGAFSVLWFLLGQIHLLTLVFGASLIGIAQDYGIYFLCSRLAAERTLGSRQLLQRLWPGLTLTLTAALVGYLGLALTPFPGLRQMALFSGLGLLFAWLTVVCWFPVLIHPDTLKVTALAQRLDASRIALSPLRLNRKTMLVALLFCLFIGAGWLKLSVSDDVRSLQKPAPALLADQIKLSRLLDAPSPVQFYLVRGASSQQVLQREEALQEKLAPLIQQGTISGLHALSNWMPSLLQQQADQKLIAERLLSTHGPLPKLAAKIGEGAAWVNLTQARMRSASVLLTPEAFLKTPASAPWHYLWLGQVGNEYASIVAVRGLHDYAKLPSLKQVAVGLDGVQWVDKIGEISSLLAHYRGTMSWVVLCAYLAIYALLLLRYRSAAWRVLAPPALASLATLAVLAFFGQPLQLFHVLALMLVLGLGVDYGIFLQEQSAAEGRFAWLTVCLSAISALLSFGLLGLSATPPLHAFGVTMLIGMALVWLLAPIFGVSYSNKN